MHKNAIKKVEGVKNFLLFWAFLKPEKPDYNNPNLTWTQKAVPEHDFCYPNTSLPRNVFFTIINFEFIFY